MIAEILPSNYDIAGKPVSGNTIEQQPLFHRTFPMRRYVSHPLSVKCSNFREMREFLSKCKYVSDQKQFRVKDYWMPPDEFEKRKKGDCEDFAFWTWRQLMAMGYKSRFVTGTKGNPNIGHAWVTIEKGGKNYLVEPQAWYLGESMPRLDILKYTPTGSVDWDGKRFHYFIHKKPDCSISMIDYFSLILEWLLFLPKTILSKKIDLD